MEKRSEGSESSFQKAIFHDSGKRRSLKLFRERNQRTHQHDSPSSVCFPFFGSRKVIFFLDLEILKCELLQMKAQNIKIVTFILSTKIKNEVVFCILLGFWKNWWDWLNSLLFTIRNGRNSNVVAWCSSRFDSQKQTSSWTANQTRSKNKTFVLHFFPVWMN